MFISRNSLNVLAYYNSKTKLIRRFEVFFKTHCCQLRLVSNVYMHSFVEFDYKYYSL